MAGPCPERPVTQVYLSISGAERFENNHTELSSLWHVLFQMLVVACGIPPISKQHLSFKIRGLKAQDVAQ